MTDVLTEDRLVEEMTRIIDTAVNDCIVVGPGDDGCVVYPPPGHPIVSSIDQHIDNVHFPLDVGGGRAFAKRAMAAALSDLAAMGATPLWALVAATLPKARLGACARDIAMGLRDAAKAWDCPIAGGDIAKTDGPASLHISVHGYTSVKPLLRRGAVTGDDIWVSHELGGALLGREQLLGTTSYRDHDWRHRYLEPVPEIALGRALASLAHSAMDISDGLASDLPRMCRMSDVGARIEVNLIPVVAGLSPQDVVAQASDDYKLLFTAPQASRNPIHRVCKEARRIGICTSDLAIQWLGMSEPPKGFDHIQS